MTRLSMALALLCAVLTESSLHADTVLPPDRVILLGARWCGPCQGELAQLPEIVRAASGRRVTLAWIDGTLDPAGWRQMPAVEVLTAARAKTLMEAQGVLALPAVLVTDRSGKLCARRNRAVRPADLPSLLKACGG